MSKKKYFLVWLAELNSQAKFCRLFSSVTDIPFHSFQWDADTKNNQIILRLSLLQNLLQLSYAASAAKSVNLEASNSHYSQ